MIMIARPVNDHLVIGTLGQEATKGSGAELARQLVAAVIRFSKSVGAARPARLRHYSVSRSRSQGGG